MRGLSALLCQALPPFPACILSIEMEHPSRGFLLDTAASHDVVIAGRQFCEANLESNPSTKEAALAALVKELEKNREKDDAGSDGTGGGSGGSAAPVGRRCRLAIVTWGSDGACAAFHAASFQPGLLKGAAAATQTLDARTSYEPEVISPADVVDSVGAGDSFNAAIILGVLEIFVNDQLGRPDIAGVLQWACEVGRRKCLVEGFGPELRSVTM